eukprot:gb/GECH01011293.1/.p1 GENE.gb/GECH01011293.1/~~gb/GECH01011293.1/.p1  ORF type:complete len:361 (+),score=88.77 gb/GECH01011293.1/:1-1083(+)
MALKTTKFAQELIETANKISTPGKGILAADESTGTIGKRFSQISVENVEENRRAYRELLFTSPEEYANYISGVIMFEETLYQKTEEGTSFVDVLKKKGVVPGIKVDKGVVKINSTDETVTQGHDKLGERCAAYYEQGARFAKWRAVLRINPEKGFPSELSIVENARGLARYAAICQENGLVPIVEPEILMDGSHSLDICLETTVRVITACYKALNDHNVLLEGSLLKPNMVLPGKQAEKQASPEEIAKATVTALQRSVPAAVPGINFLSGGQSEEEATLNLNAINQYKGKKPWHLSFSYGRALQTSTLQAWKGDKNNKESAQKAFVARCKANSLAQLGKYAGGTGGNSATSSNYEANYTY